MLLIRARRMLRTGQFPATDTKGVFAIIDH